jgi:hypothetical protein
MRILSRTLKRILSAFVLIFLMTTCGIVAQQVLPGLKVDDFEVVTRPDAFGAETLFAEGVMVNSDDVAYENISLYAEVYNGTEMVGEGFGYPVNACGTGLLQFALQPGEEQTFSVSLELYEDGAAYNRVEIIPEASETTPRESETELPSAIAQATEREVVSVEWIDETNLRYGVGCDADVFSNWQWFQYDVAEGVSFPIAHPRAEFITPAMLQQVGLTDPELFRRSYLSFHPNDTRMVYQTDLNTVITAERDGSFKRIIYDNLSRVSLHGFQWLPEGRFLAYYYGAYGDPVRYYTASLLGQRISDTVYEVIPSQTLPGSTPDGARVVIGGTINEQTGYFLSSTIGTNVELLFEAELPGNNYPAPILVPQEGGVFYIYIVRPVGGQTELQCFNTGTRNLTPITPLPLTLTQDDRAWTWLSPQRTTMALSASGQDGGLWMVDLQGTTC